MHPYIPAEPRKGWLSLALGYACWLVCLEPHFHSQAPFDSILPHHHPPNHTTQRFPTRPFWCVSVPGFGLCHTSHLSNRPCWSTAFTLSEFVPAFRPLYPPPPRAQIFSKMPQGCACPWLLAMPLCLICLTHPQILLTCTPPFFQLSPANSGRRFPARPFRSEAIPGSWLPPHVTSVPLSEHPPPRSCVAARFSAGPFRSTAVPGSWLRPHVTSVPLSDPPPRSCVAARFSARPFRSTAVPGSRLCSDVAFVAIHLAK